ncbi:hypothetical protein CTC_02385 [Clostridium tetani E88]|uniref:Uncharacterized protein n=1 Tax=Clostridium tetani (strain Massachusetts / E88) TaxID=212717 RepID=Q891I7_CLOTE|nr:hypothetical protein CTC_02385 [Clostridium tetani E88]
MLWHRFEYFVGSFEMFSPKFKISLISSIVKSIGSIKLLPFNMLLFLLFSISVLSLKVLKNAFPKGRHRSPNVQYSYNTSFKVSLDFFKGFIFSYTILSLYIL